MNKPSSSFAPVNHSGTESVKSRSVPKSLVDHRRQSIWQIWIPLGFGVAVLLALFILMILTSTRNSDVPSVWRNLSLIFMIIPIVLAGLVLLGIFVGLVYLFARLLNILPTYTQLGQAYFRKFSSVVRMLADRAVNPFLAIRSFWAGITTIWRRFS